MSAVLRLLLACALACLTCAQASAQNVDTRPITLTFAEQPTLAFSAKDFANAAVQKKLQSGLPQMLIMRIYAYREHGKDPLAVTALSCRVVYDLWEGVYRIERQTEHTDKTLSAKSMDGVVQQCLDLKSFAFGDANTFAGEHGKRVYLAVIIELNPLSQDTVQRIRRWLARPGGNQLEGNAFFGSFVSIFVSRKLSSAEKTLTFRTDLIAVPP